MVLKICTWLRWPRDTLNVERTRGQEGKTSKKLQNSVYIIILSR